MEKKITGYTTVDISQWHRKEHFEAFQSVAQCTYNQTVQLDITAFGNDSNLLIVFYVQIMPDDFVMQLHRF